MKTCSKCQVGKPLSEFFKDSKRRDGATPWCKACFKSFNSDNKQAIASYQRSYYDSNKTKIIERKRAYSSRRMKTDVQYRLRKSVKLRLRAAIDEGVSKSKLLNKYLGCSFERLKQHVESQFYADMSWENHGARWHLDHAIPLAKLDLTKDSDLKKGLHFSNLQPMLAENNRKKGDRRPVVYLVTGTFGVGKSWVCGQLTEDCHYVSYDSNRGSHLRLLCNPPDFNKPIVYDRHVNVNKFINTFKDLLEIRPVFILETEETIRARLALRGGEFTKAGEKKMRRMVFLAKRHAMFSGTSTECLDFLKRELGRNN